MAFEDDMKKATAKGADGIHGVILSAVHKSGKPIYNKTFGYHSIAPDAPAIDPDGTLWIASCTKLLSSICALQCVERGLIKLDEPVQRVLPELASPQIASLDTSGEIPGETGKVILTPAKKPITLRHLITHTSGIAYEWMNETLKAWREDWKRNGGDEAGLRKSTAKLYSIPLIHEPGEGWAYGGGLDWAGVLVSRLSNDVTLEQYMQEHIFKPLGMESTTFHIDRHPEIRKRLVATSRRTEDGKLEEAEVPFSMVVPDEAEAGGGGLFGSVPDYMRVLLDLISDSPTLLKKDTLDTLVFAPSIPEGPAIAALVANRLTTGSMGQLSDLGLNYGLGGMFFGKNSPSLPASSLCWGGLPNIKWFANRDRGVAGMYATQLLPPGDELSSGLATKFNQEVWRIVDEGLSGT